LAASTSLAIAAGTGTAASAAPSAAARAAQVPAEADGLGQLSGILPANHLTLPSAIEVNLSQEYVRLPIYPGIAYAGTSHQEKVWYILEDASTPGAADDPGVNYAPKLANMAIGCAVCVQTVHLINPTPEQNHFGPAPISFAGAPDFGPTRIAVPGPDGFPLAKFQPCAVAGPGTARSSRSPGRTRCTTRRSSPPGTARWCPRTPCRPTRAFINALRYGGDALNVFGDFPTLTDPRHADAYSPLWDDQLAMWTPKAVAEGLNKRQINENTVLNLAYSRPDLLTGVNPATGQPQLYGSVGVDIDCAVIGYTATAPTSPGPRASRVPSSRPGNRQAAAGAAPPMWPDRRRGTSITPAGPQSRSRGHG